MNQFELSINVTIRQNGGGYLQVNEQLQVDASGFMEMCEVLGQFHNLAEKIRQQKAKK